MCFLSSLCAANFLFGYWNYPQLDVPSHINQELRQLLIKMTTGQSALLSPSLLKGLCFT